MKAIIIILLAALLTFLVIAGSLAPGGQATPQDQLNQELSDYGSENPGSGGSGGSDDLTSNPDQDVDSDDQEDGFDEDNDNYL